MTTGRRIAAAVLTAAISLSIIGSIAPSANAAADTSWGNTKVKPSPKK